MSKDLLKLKPEEVSKLIAESSGNLTIIKQSCMLQHIKSKDKEFWKLGVMGDSLFTKNPKGYPDKIEFKLVILSCGIQQGGVRTEEIIYAEVK